ncbi:ABC transporter permease [Nocardia sp. SC052]|uniref:ABC transporter permease n=1 Tax=Nocardia sichangensis TaxID=3385975 RepID=UPI0039A2BAE8
MSTRAFLAASRVQVLTSIRAPEHLVIVFLAPWFSLIFLSMSSYAGRMDLATVMVLGTGLIGIWFVAVNVAAGAIHNDRIMGTLEMAIVSPSNYAIVLCGRIVPIVVLGTLVIPEAWLVGKFAFNAELELRNPLLVSITLVMTCLATVGTATLLAAVMVISRNTRIIQGNLEYPLYVLGGTILPIDQLPDVARLVARLFYLSWAADLLRDAALRSSVPDARGRLAIIGALGVVAFISGAVLVRYTIYRARLTASVSTS